MKIRSSELTEQMAKENALEVMDIKGYTVYFLQSEWEYYGYYCVAFKNGFFITDNLAGKYKPYEGELPSNEELREKHINAMNNCLYTEEELATVTDYLDYDVKAYFLHNYYGREREYMSMFCINDKGTIHTLNGDLDCSLKLTESKYPVFNQVGFCYNKEEDKDFVKHMYELFDKLNKARVECEQSDEYMRKAFEYEMDNHEYAINWQGDWDVCSVFGECKYGEDKDYTDYLKEMGKENLIPIYAEARKSHMKRAANW